MNDPRLYTVSDDRFGRCVFGTSASSRFPSGGVSATLPPQSFSDSSLSRALRRASGRSHRRLPLPSPARRATTGSADLRASSTELRTPRPIVDVVAAFGRRESKAVSPPSASPRVSFDPALEVEPVPGSVGAGPPRTAGLWEAPGERLSQARRRTEGRVVLQPSPTRESQGENPTAVAERVLYALLRQNDEAHANPNAPASALLVSPQDRGVLVDLVRAKDREILQLRGSLAISYRCAALALCRERQMRGEGLSVMEQRFVSALANIEPRSSQASPQLLVNRAPPHVHGLPDVPVPLSLPRSVGKVYGMLSMLIVEDMAQKRTAMRVFKRNWRVRFVVADDRGLAIFRSEEDYKQHAFQRALLVVPFRDLEYFVPSFRDLPMQGAELFKDVVANNRTGNPDRDGGADGERNHSGGFFASLARHFTSQSRDGRGKSVGRNVQFADSPAQADVSASAVVSGSRGENAQQAQHSHQRGSHDLYDEFMARVAIEYVDDMSFAYFGFVPKQPNTQLASKVTNPPILFRTQSTQVHAEWVHYLTQSFNRKLYREMFPSALAESYVGTVTKDTQTCEETQSETNAENQKEEEEPRITYGCHETDSRVPLPFLRVTETVAAVPMRVAAAAQTSPRAQRDASTHAALTESHETQTQTQQQPPPPPPPQEAPPKPKQWHSDSSGHFSGEGVPWAQLVSELRDLLAAKNTERDALQRESAAWRDDAQCAAALRDEALAQREEIAKDCERMAKELDAAQQAAVEREERFTREAAEMRAERDLLMAELRAARDGFGEGLRAMARRALGDIDCLHDAYTAEEYLSGLRHCSTSGQDDCEREKENETEKENKKEKEKAPTAPPPAASLRAPPPLRRPHAADDSLNDSSEGIGVALLLLSYSPRSRVIDGCFTVDERHARLLRSAPSETRLGREWVIHHHDTGAVLAVRTELQAERAIARTSPSPMRRSCGRGQREKERKGNVLKRK